jgi:hypothetical protein
MVIDMDMIAGAGGVQLFALRHFMSIATVAAADPTKTTGE